MRFGQDEAFVSRQDRVFVTTHILRIPNLGVLGTFC